MTTIKIDVYIQLRKCLRKVLLYRMIAQLSIYFFDVSCASLIQVSDSLCTYFLTPLSSSTSTRQAADKYRFGNRFRLYSI